MGMDEHEVLDFPIDKFRVYIKEAAEIEKRDRQAHVVDTHIAAAGIFKSKIVKDHLEILK